MSPTLQQVMPSAEDQVLLGVEYGDLAEGLRRLSPEFRSVVQAGRWMPFAAASSLMQLGSSGGDQLLSVAMGGLVLLGYPAVTVVLALLITP